jgi:hypothetical protein
LNTALSADVWKETLALINDKIVLGKKEFVMKDYRFVNMRKRIVVYVN